MITKKNIDATVAQLDRRIADERSCQVSGKAAFLESASLSRDTEETSILLEGFLGDYIMHHDTIEELELEKYNLDAALARLEEAEESAHSLGTADIRGSLKREVIKAGTSPNIILHSDGSQSLSRN